MGPFKVGPRLRPKCIILTLFWGGNAEKCDFGSMKKQLNIQNKH